MFLQSSHRFLPAERTAAKPLTNPIKLQMLMLVAHQSQLSLRILFVMRANKVTDQHDA